MTLYSLPPCRAGMRNGIRAATRVPSVVGTLGRLMVPRLVCSWKARSLISGECIDLRMRTCLRR
jgi:hypothetical protein